MQSIIECNKEMDMEQALLAAYHECWRRLINAIPNLTQDEFSQLSNPFLVKCLPAYRKAKRKVLFIGQETNGWDSFETTLATMNSGDFYKDREDIINYLQWMYEDLRFHRKYDYQAFWKGMRRLYQAISPNESDDGFLHTELVRFDLNNNRPPLHVEELLQKEYNVLPLEIMALQPDVIVFLTGPYYDQRIRETFNNIGVRHQDVEYVSIKGFEYNHLVRLSHPKLPFHTYRTYHPLYSIQQRKIEAVEDYFENLILD